MSRIADKSLEEVRDKSDIVEVVREYVPALKRAGRNWKACCPFHQERTPSFMVNPEKQIFHCFGCQAGGDVFKFVMQLEGLSFPESIEKLAERAGVRLERPEDSGDPAAQLRAKVRAVLSFARDWYHEQLLKGASAKAGRDYLKKRGLGGEEAKAWGLGFAPKEGGLIPAAQAKGYDAKVLISAGLAAERSGRLRDYFWDRVLFPIDDAKGETIGFGARTMGDGEPKYLNSPETPVFSKGRVLYGLHAALPAVRKERRALLLEGYMDVIACHQFGFTTACAPLGTALTEDHVRHLKRHADRLVLVFDSDAAGARAALRGAEIVLEQGLSVSVAAVEGGKDPDEVLRSQGPRAMQAAIDGARSLPSFKTEMLLAAGGGRMGPEDKARIAREVLSTITKCPDEVLKDEWIKELAARLEVNEASVRRQMERGAPESLGRPVRQAAPGRTAPLPVVEREILFHLFKTPSLAASDGLLAESDFADARARDVFRAMREALSGGSEDWETRLMESLNDEEAALARELLCDERETADGERILSHMVGKLRKERRLGEIEPLVLGADRGGPPVDPEVHKEYTRLVVELKGSRKGE